MFPFDATGELLILRPGLKMKKRRVAARMPPPDQAQNKVNKDQAKRNLSTSAPNIDGTLHFIEILSLA
jgi:hypothetical protein